MEDIIPTLILIAGVYFLARWLFQSKTANHGATSDSIRGVTRSMVDTISSAFPDIPPPNIIYSLSQTRSAQVTSEELLERGYLPAPPESFRVPPSLLPPTSTSPIVNISSKPSTKPVQSLIERYGLATRIPSVKGKEKEVVRATATESDLGEGTVLSPKSLATGESEVGDGREVSSSRPETRDSELRRENEVSPSQTLGNDVTLSTSNPEPSKVAAEKRWEETPEKREMGLRERKEKMILKARQRLLDKQAKLEAGTV